METRVLQLLSLTPPPADFSRHIISKSSTRPVRRLARTSLLRVRL
jgi:hypothetical protein